MSFYGRVVAPDSTHMPLRTGALLALAVAATLSASQAPAPPPRVTGVVRDAITRAPLAGARVRVAAYNEEWCEPCMEFVNEASVTTDRQGRFTIDYTPETFVLEADATGYSRGGFGVRRGFGRAARIDLAEGQHLADAEILLFREAVVQGRVTDASGKPLSDIDVNLVLVSGDGSSQWADQGDERGEATPATTDAQGYYTAYVAPGRYTAMVLRGPIPTFHPAATNIREATLVTLRPGDVRKGIDVRIRPNQAAVVQARVNLPPDSPILKLSAGVSLRDNAIEIDGKYQGGNIEFTNVPYGNYTLTAEFVNGDLFDVAAGRPQTLNSWAQATVRVDQAHVGPIELVPQPSVVVSGTVTTVGGPPSLMPGIQLRAAEDDRIPCGLFRFKGDLAKDGRFLLRARPGQYRLCVWPAKGDGSEEATLNGRDIVDLPFRVTQDVQDIQVVVNPTRSRLRGTVHDSRDRPAREGWVVVFPADRSFWPHARKESGRFRSVRVSVAGVFEIDNLLPGQYLVVAVDDESISGWPNEAWIARLARGAEAVTITRGDVQEIRSLIVRSNPLRPLAAPQTDPYRVTLFDIRSFFSRTGIPGVTVDLEGTVRDPTGKPAVRAKLTLRSEGYTDAEAFTGLNGRYRFGNLPPGHYALTAEADVPFGHQPVLAGSAPQLPMFVTDVAEVEVKIEKSQVIDLRLSPIRRPSFGGHWILDERNSSTATASQGLDELGLPATILDVDDDMETIRWSRGLFFVVPTYRPNGTAEEFTMGGHEVTALSRWQGERLVTRLTVAASANRPARTYEETRWLEKNGTMVVEIRGEGGVLLRRLVYK